jgi:hypothetical protein
VLHQTQNHNETGSNGSNEIAYTWELGNGTTFNVFAGERRTKSVFNASVANFTVGGAPGTSVHGQQYLNPGASLFVRQAWGDFKLSVNTNPIHQTYFTAAPGAPGYAPSLACQQNPGTTFCDYASDKWGASVSSSLKINTPWITPGDFFVVQGGYSVGANSYANGNNLSSVGLFGGGNQVATGAVTDAVFVNGAGFQLTTAWTVATGYMHWWTPNFSSTIVATHTEYHYNNTVVQNRWFCGGGGARVLNVNLTAAANARGDTCDPGFTYETLAGQVNWFPVKKNFRLAAEVLYTRIGTAFEGQTLVLAATPNGSARPTGLYLAKNQGILSGVFRAQLDFPGSDE